MTDPNHYWPGGIPSHIRCHPEPLSEGCCEATRGWQLFLEENAVARNTSNTEENFEIKQRRELVDRWASMSQKDRDSYQNRAPPRAEGAKWFPLQLRDTNPRQTTQFGFCNLIVQQPLNPRNRALWTKICILLYRLDTEDTAHNFTGKDNVVEIYSNPAGHSLVTPETYYVHCFVEPADFDFMAMTVQGTVIFHYVDSGIFFVDQESLDTGRLLLCDIDNNGQVLASSRMWPLWTYMVYCFIFGLGWYADRIIRDYGLADGDDDSNNALDMELPILELLEAKKDYFENDVDKEYWKAAIEEYAPGYLEMEEAGNGMAPDYNHANLFDG